MAGTDTTRNQLAAAIHTLCDHPDQWAAAGRESRARAQRGRRDPASFPDRCRHLPRRDRRDVELAGVTIPAGTLVVVEYRRANRDPAVYDDPDRLDITRDAPSAMLTFGGGVHYCLGSHLARAELVEALTVMARRMPNARRTGPAPWKPLTGLSGPITLPIEFDTGH